MKFKSIFYTIITGCLFLMASFTILQVQQNEEKNIKVETLQNQTAQLRSISKIDKIRKGNINKIFSVINRFNESMTEELKYNIASEIYDVSLKYDNLDVDLICATITHESAFTWDPKVVSPKGAMGLMQIMPSTGEFLAKIEGINWTRPEDVLFDPVVNIQLGSRYLSSLIEMYEIDGGLAAYNGGGKRVALWLAQNKAHGILFEETQKYVPAVLSLYEEFRN